MKHRISLGLRAMMVIIILSLLLPAWIFAQSKRPYTISHMTTPFGTVGYITGTALEEVFKKADSWVQWKFQETPGAMYMNKYIFKNRKKLASGEMPPVITNSSASIMAWFKEGRPPFKKIMVPEASGGLFSSPSYVSVFLTFDKNIKSTRDFVGKKVGIPEKSRPFMSILPLKPYFAKGLGIWNKVDWQFIGVTNSKDALLNNRIDVHLATFFGRIETQPDGTQVVVAGSPRPADMEIMNSGRKFYVIPFEGEIITKSFDFSRNMMLFPGILKKGAVKGINHDVPCLVSNGMAKAPMYLPKDVVKEIIRVRYHYRKELAKYHSSLAYFPENPYPVGIPEKWVVPGVREAVEELGLEVPKD